MHINRIYITILFFLLQLYWVDANSQTSFQVKKTDKDSYEVTCEMNFPKNVSNKLIDFCWNMKNITHLLADQPVTVNYEGNEYGQYVSYKYKFMFMHHYSRYFREKSYTLGTIKFNLVKSDCNIPIIPKTQSVSGQYTFTTNNNITTMHFIQKSKLGGAIPDIYLNNIRNGFAKYFSKFETEAIKSIYK